MEEACRICFGLRLHVFDKLRYRRLSASVLHPLDRVRQVNGRDFASAPISHSGIGRVQLLLGAGRQLRRKEAGLRIRQCPAMRMLRMGCHGKFVPESFVEQHYRGICRIFYRSVGRSDCQRPVLFA